jgi:hypothetical protein
VATALMIVTFILNAINVSMIAAVMVMHFIAYKRAPAGAGLMPLHVVAVSLAHILFIVVATASVRRYIVEFHDYANWRVILYFIASAVTISALVIVGEYQRRRLNQ